MNVRQRVVLIAIAEALIDAVKAAGPHGAPAGVLYAACMAYGISLDHFQQLMTALVKVGKLTYTGHLYYLPGQRDYDN